MTAERSRHPSAFTSTALAARRVGEQLVTLSAAVDAAFEQACRPEQLTQLQARLLRLLLDPQPQRELAERLGIDAPRVSRLTRALEDRGLLARSTSGGDHRLRISRLTEDGLATVERVSARLVDTSPLLGVLDEDELEQLAELLGRLNAPAESSNPEVSPHR